MKAHWTLLLLACRHFLFEVASMATEPSAPNGSGAREGQQLISILNTISTDSIQHEGERCQALLAAYALVSRLETPWETIARLCMGQV